MKLATRNASSRDGQLMVVSSDHKWWAPVGDAPTLIDALERWSTVEWLLTQTYKQLSAKGSAFNGAEPFDVKACLAPLPRSYGFFDGSAFLSHVERARKARGDVMPESAKKTPLMYQGVSDKMLPWNAPLEILDEAYGGDFEGEFAVITTEVPRGTSAADAPKYTVLLTLFNDTTLREIVKTEIETKFGFLQSKPNNAFAPIVATPDEFGDRWANGRLGINLEAKWNGETFGAPNGREMHFSFFELVAHACRTRGLAAGTIVGSGTISNADAGAGFACLTEKRFIEVAEAGKPATRWLRPGDEVRLTAKDGDTYPFGTIVQQVTLS